MLTPLFVMLRNEASPFYSSNKLLRKFNSGLIVFISIIFLSFFHPLISFSLAKAICIQVNFSKYNKK